MIVRIVKMVFEPESVDQFITIFNSVREKILAAPGCKSLILYRDKSASNIFFTYSNWLSEDYLEQYRQSTLFRETWAKTKVLFKDKAEAWSVEQITSKGYVGDS